MQVNAEAVVAVADGGDGLQVQPQTLVQDVMATGIEESLEQGDALQTQYIVQNNETATALFYLTGSLKKCRAEWYPLHCPRLLLTALI